GQELRMRVIKVNKKRGNIVLSRKVLLEEENAEKKKHTLDTLAEGKVLRGVVKNITDYGAFIDLGGIDGLLHITDMWWARSSKLRQVLQMLDIKVNKKRGNIRRTPNGLLEDESDEKNKHTHDSPAGRNILRNVLNHIAYYAAVIVQGGIDGLIHISDMSWSK